MIYVSVLYAQGDEGLAERLAGALSQHGCEAYPASGDALEGDLADDGTPALVIWTRRSVRAPDIIRHARSAMARGTLIPIKVAGASPPEDFAALAPADLTGWTGDDHDPRWRFVTEEIKLIAARGRLSDGNVWAAPATTETERFDEKAADRGFENAGCVAVAEKPASPALEEEEPAFGFDFSPPPSARPVHGGGFSIRHVAFVAAGVLLGATGLATFTAPMIFTADTQPQIAASGSATSDHTPADAPAEQPSASATLSALTIDIPETDEMTADVAPQTEAEASPPAPALKSPPPLRDAEPVALASADDAAAREPAIAQSPRIKPAGQALPGGDPQAEETSIDVESAESAAGDYLRDCIACPDMAVVPAGRFLMGSPETERARHDAEGPVAMVDIAGGFAMAAREVTMAQWDACVAGGGCRAYTPPAHGWGRGEQPVVSVSFEDAQSYVAWLSGETGRTYRLPSEAEWEYAARAGTAGPFSFGFRVTPDDANYNARYTYGGPVGTAADRAVKTASFAPNAFGLYDMHGNVWEWTADCWAEGHQDADVTGAPRNEANGGDCESRVLKGGAWNTGGWRLRSAHRIGKPAGVREYDNGFRVARDLD